MDCPFEECRSSLKPWNTATNFSGPSLSVKFAVNTGIISPDTSVLEFGSGNLRNALYTLRMLPEVQYNVVEIAEVIDRFRNNYTDFEQLGGFILQGLPPKRTFDVIVCTFVLETICPSSKRVQTLQLIAEKLKERGTLLASFRGWPGVKGTKYKQCQAREGFITPLKTFVKPFSLPEVEELLHDSGFNNIETIKKYRTMSPQNIHILAKVRGRP